MFFWAEQETINFVACLTRIMATLWPSVDDDDDDDGARAAIVPLTLAATYDDDDDDDDDGVGRKWIHCAKIHVQWLNAKIYMYISYKRRNAHFKHAEDLIVHKWTDKKHNNKNNIWILFSPFTQLRKYGVGVWKNWHRFEKVFFFETVIKIKYNREDKRRNRRKHRHRRRQQSRR